MSARPRILFVTHEVTRTGAPIVLLRLLRWLVATGDYDVQVVTVRRGELLADFAEVAPTTLVETLPGIGLRQAAELGRNLEAKAGRRIGGRLEGAASAARARQQHLRLRSLRDFDLIYASSAESGAIFGKLPHPLPPIITHVHELGFSLDHLLPEGATENVLAMSSHLVACSDGVQRELLRRGADPAETSVCPELIEVSDLPVRSTRDEVRSELGLPPGAFLVGGSGTRDWRKGIDLFVRLAWEAQRLEREVDLHFVWVGGSAARFVDEQLRYDATELGVGARVHFVDPTPDPHRYYAALDVLAMTSREDPYPLVILEAGLHGVPLVTFESGGAADFARRGAGVVVPYGDVAAMAAALLSLYVDRDRRNDLGSAAAELARGHDVAILGPQLVDLIERIRRQ